MPVRNAHVGWFGRHHCSLGWQTISFSYNSFWECGHHVLKVTSCFLGAKTSLGDPEIFLVNCKAVSFVVQSLYEEEVHGLSQVLDHLRWPPRNFSEQFVVQS